MADICDVADKGIERALEDARRRATGKSGPESDPRFDGTHCVEPDCEVVIPPARLALGKVRCVDCQGLLEKRGRMKNYGPGE